MVELGESLCVFNGYSNSSAMRGFLVCKSSTSDWMCVSQAPFWSDEPVSGALSASEIVVATRDGMVCSIYDAHASVWRACNRVSPRETTLYSGVVVDGMFFVAGTPMCMFDPRGDKWTQRRDRGRTTHGRAVRIDDTSFALFGGQASGVATAGWSVYDIRADQWREELQWGLPRVQTTPRVVRVVM